MNYQRNNYQKSNQQNQQRDQKPDAIRDITQEIKNKSGSLSAILTPEDLYLPQGKAHRIAEALGDSLNINQLRKIFTMIGRANELAEANHFQEAKESLYMVVPMVAYATGRELVKPDSFNTFFQVLITPSRIQSVDDITTFHKMIQSILAFKKK